MTERSWKKLERRLARDVGSERVPVTGERAGADFRGGMFAYQAKLGRRFPAYLLKWLAGIRASAERSGKTGVVVWKRKGARDTDALVVLTWADWVELHGTAGAPAAPEDRAA